MSGARQPRPGDRYVVCRHVEGDAVVGFNSAHILRIVGNDGPTVFRTDPKTAQTVGLPLRWMILCDDCARVGGAIEGWDGVWPEGSRIVYQDAPS